MRNEALYQDKCDSYYSNSRTEILPFIPSGVKRLLDIGCGSGNFGKMLKSSISDCIVWGVEPDEKTATKARKHLDHVLNVSFDIEIDLQGQKFDCIFFNDILEHLVDPYSALNFSKSLLLPGGYVISSIPNILYFPVIERILRTQDWRYEDFGILDRTHLRFFTKKSIRRLFTENGFEVVMISGINPCREKKLFVLNLLFLNTIKDMRYMQFLTVAKI